MPRKGLVSFIQLIFLFIRLTNNRLKENNIISIGPLINIDKPTLVQRRMKLIVFFSFICLKYLKSVTNFLLSILFL